MNKRKDGKITLGMIKGKPINTSVPSIAIRFHANAEELEELYQSEEESVDKSSNDKSLDKSKCAESVGDLEGSPLRSYLPRIGKRSSSIDTSFTVQDSSPPSDPWKFFHEIKGKITKSVEDTITEIKQRNQEGEGSAKKSKLAKDKDNSSLSDSEDMSESSISKTCGAISTTTEGVEMSSDDDTPSLEKDKKPSETSKLDTGTPIKSAEKQRFRFIKKKKPNKEGKIPLSTLANIYEINTGLKASISEEKRLTSDDNIEEVESGVEALEDINLQAQNNGDDESELLFPSSEINFIHRASTEDVLSNIAETVDNVKIDDNKVLNIEQVSGTDIRDSLVSEEKTHTFLAPEGFVDLRPDVTELSWFDIIYSYRYVSVIVGVVLFYCYMSIPVYISGFIAGCLFSSALIGVYNKLYSLNTKTTGLTDTSFSIPSYSSQAILEVPAAKEYQPIAKFEGWMNEYPDEYNPETYQLTHTQSVYIRVQGNLLRISHPRVKIPKRAVWNEPKHKLVFSHHRIYNLLGAKVNLLPEGLVKKRHWSKKYPICITLNKDQLNFDYWNQTDSVKTVAASMNQTATPTPSEASGVSENVKKNKNETSTRTRRIFASKKQKYAAPYGSESYLPKPDKASCFTKLLRRFHKLTIVSPVNPICKRFFRSNAAIAFERKRHVRSDVLYIVHPFSIFRTYWEVWMTLVFFLALVINPIQVTFEFETEPTLRGLSLVVTVVDFICIVDIILTFFTGYGISTSKEVILEPGKIAKRYILSVTFYMDVLSSIPIELIQYFLLNLFSEKTWRIASTVELLKIFRFRTFTIYMRRTADMWQVTLLVFLAVRYFIILMLLIHWTACLHYAVPNMVLVISGDLESTSWIAISQLNEFRNNFDRYVRCVFRACSYLFCVNHGIYEVLTQEDILVGIVTFIVGYLLSALLLVLTLQIVSSVLSAETKYQEIINQVYEYMGYKQLPSNMQKRLISYYEYRFQKSYFREDVISATLSERLRREINVFCYRRLVDSVSIFKDMPQHTVVDIVNSLKAEIFLPNDIIVKAGTIGECMYFLASGTVCVVTPTGREAQLFSKLTEEDDFTLESESSRPSTPSPVEEEISSDVSEVNIKLTDEEVTELLKDTFDQDEDQMEDDMLSISDWGTFTPEPESPTETHIYLFARTDREKEDWYRWFAMATHRGAHLVQPDNASISSETSQTLSDTLINSVKHETEYLKYMAKLQKKKILDSPTPEEAEKTASVLWINALIGRVLFDCTRDENFTKKVQERIQRKLSTLKMPMFVERLIISELSLGSTPPIIHKASNPVLDQRGLWIDLDVTYEGVVVLTLLTKLNLMKLRHPPTADISVQNTRAAKWQNSDVDDTAESSTDDDNVQFIPPSGKLLEDGTATSAVNAGGTSNKGKKFIKMVDKIAESKFFQAATENRLIKKAMEGVSNTDFGLKVELKGLAGTLVLNVPPPPSDRIWLGFRPTPKLWLTAQPIVGERNISFFGQVTSIIEKKLSQEFQKVLVIPNMEDILIPVMSSKLPE